MSIGLGAVGTADQSEVANTTLERARQIYREEGPKAALPVYEDALSHFRQVGDRSGEAITLGYIGNCYKRFGEFDRALELLETALEMKQELGDRLEMGKTLSHLGLVYWELGEYETAIDHLERSISLAREENDLSLEGASLNNLSLVYDELGDYDRSLQQYEKVLEIFRDLDDPDGESYTLGNIGGVYLLLGRFREAVDYYRQSMAIGERLGLKPSLCHDLGNLAMCQLGLGEVEEALQSITHALQLARETGLKQDEAYWLRVEGSIFLAQGRYGLGLESYREGLDILEEIEANGELVEARSELGSIFLTLGDIASAEDYFRRSAELARSTGHARGLTYALLSLGDLDHRRQRYEEAEALFSQALERVRDSGEKDLIAIGHLHLARALRDQGRIESAAVQAAAGLDQAIEIEAPLLEARARWELGEIALVRGDLAAALALFDEGGAVVGRVGDPELLWRLHYGRGRALAGQGKKREAVAAFKRSVQEIESVRGRLKEDRFRAGYLEDRYQVYIDLVRLLLELGDIEDAFVTAERLRARNFLSLLNRGSPPAPTEVERRKEIELRQRIRRLEEALEEESSGSSLQRRDSAIEIYSRELLEAEREYQAFMDDHLASGDSYPALRALAIPSVRQLQSRLPVDVAVVEYVVSDDDIVIFVLTSRRLEAQVVQIDREQLRVKIDLLRDLVLRQSGELWRETAASLGQTLIEPIEKAGWLQGIRQIRLVPHGVLHYLPFSLLSHRTDRGLRLLVEDFDLTSLPSVAMMADSHPPSVSLASLLAMAPGKANLRWASEEVRSLTAHYPERNLVLVGDEATEGAFKRQVQGYRTVHLATHGHFNKLNPLLSGLELEADSTDDGRLEVHEILRLRLAADLVTLSACDTALGSGYFSEVPAGDDFVGLTRSFLLAGSSAVLATLWKVDDRSTRDLMKSFYSSLSQVREASLSVALARAQRELIDSGGPFSHPYYWAPFVLVGGVD